MDDEYDVLVAERVAEFLDGLDTDSERIVRNNLAKLTEPYPGRGKGDKEKITWRSRSVFRLHIGRTWTAFYDIEPDSQVVKVLEVMPIEQAHQEYGELD